MIDQDLILMLPIDQVRLELFIALLLSTFQTSLTIAWLFDWSYRLVRVETLVRFPELCAILTLPRTSVTRARFVLTTHLIYYI